MPSNWIHLIVFLYWNDPLCEHGSLQNPFLSTVSLQLTVVLTAKQMSNRILRGEQTERRLERLASLCISEPLQHYFKRLSWKLVSFCHVHRKAHLQTLDRLTETSSAKRSTNRLQLREITRLMSIYSVTTRTLPKVGSHISRCSAFIAYVLLLLCFLRFNYFMFFHYLFAYAAYASS